MSVKNNGVVCVVCGCDEYSACINDSTAAPCSWVVYDPQRSIYVCSECLDKWMLILRQQGIKYARDMIIGGYESGNIDRHISDVWDIANAIDIAACTLADDLTSDWVSSDYGTGWLRDNKPQPVPVLPGQCEKATYVIAYPLGGTPAVRAGMVVMGGRLISMAFSDVLEKRDSQGEGVYEHDNDAG